MKVWPKFIRDGDFTSGFTAGQLEDLVSRNRGFWEGFPKLSPVAFWETETYSFGKTYRSWLRWPWFFPLPMSGDHGVELQRRFSERELNSGARTYLTWSTWRTQPIASNKLEVIQVPHPWVTYRRAKSMIKRVSASGTLIFVPHTIQSTTRAEFDFEHYLSSLESLPDHFKPFSLCLQMHDVRKGLHEELAKFGYPIFTAGNSSSPFFVDRFYDLILRFNFCTSNIAGSQSFYCEEAGVPYFLFGLENQEHERGGPARSAYVGIEPDQIEKVRRVFAYANLGQSAEKASFVAETLGLGIDPKPAVKSLRRRLIRDVFYLGPLLTRLVLVNAFTSLRNFFTEGRLKSTHLLRK